MITMNVGTRQSDSEGTVIAIVLCGYCYRDSVDTGQWVGLHVCVWQLAAMTQLITKPVQCNC